ncbi:MAG: sigma-70 family RNA polymerase sigma factor [Planctomycetota bacterium]|nr:sigma-70 family RNA polymerase sigma factor [Planctomycetota bacterium]MEC7447723.1 sigma-70 family RNA polymerase sigma factor [Planctomycetota bacterium]
MALSERDRDLLNRCLEGIDQSWREFVDRFVGLVYQVIEHTSQSRGIGMGRQDRDDLVADVFLELIQDDFRVLRRFRGESSLATYLTVIARRIAVRELLRQQSSRRRTAILAGPKFRQDDFRRHFENADLVRRLLEQLNERESMAVQLYYLSDLKYHQIASRLGVPENSVGPTLARARKKMHRWLSQHSASQIS